ncbi:DMT family transporter [Streptomyces cellulosae]|uniref:EamA family transporter n=2 Tax=Streptomyces TaxID=1883 RepID=A0ABU3JF84_9ACTN|nr:EamA family transporter [Streptomyces sp. McG7]MDQ0491691.1 putative blue pigment (indigoidine) exporter [Streptomyces thermodiastaticus]MDT6973712.1 EamA family transporter [Streptomyces thermocarboxydus]THC50303.1 EamA family transporter [Streptomyces sp. Akac8]WSB41467.1 DMT family transporter [Streptomyces cellulosae]
MSAHRRAAVVALTALAPVSWGTTYVVTTELLPPERPLFTALVRALPAGLLLLVFDRVLPRGAWWWKAGVLGALNIGAFFPLLFLAAYRLPGGLAAVVGSVGPLLVLGLSALLLGRRPALRDVLAGTVAALGVSMVVLRAAGALDALGVAAAFASTASMAAGTVLTQKWGRPEGVGPLALTGWQLTAGGLLIAPLAFLVEGAPPALDAGAAGGYAYLVLVNTALAYVLWFRGIGRLTATQATLLGPLSPLTAAVLGWALLDESLTALQLAGMTLAFGATVAGQLRAPSADPTRPQLTPDNLAPVALPGQRLPAPHVGTGPHQRQSPSVRT